MRDFKRFLVISQITILVVGTIMISFAPQVAAAEEYQAKIKEQLHVADGIDYRDIHLQNDKLNQAVRVMEIDVNNPKASVEVGIPARLNSTQKTSSLAIANTSENSWVAGAINASFFWEGTAMNLVSKDNRLLHSGRIYPAKDSYVNEPIAFGMDKNGKGIIDYYQLQMNYIHNGETFPITATNTGRSTDETILYTSDFPKNTTEANKSGTEVVVTLDTKPTLEFGKTVTGIVTDIRKEGDEASATIPENGFVLSGSGLGSENLKSTQIGDQITLTITIDDKWKNSAFMLASGPLLVKDGKPALTMDPNSPNARQRAPRTAVAINKTGDKVFFITVDGRQSGYSNGMNLTDFANYLVELGVDTALNLDGGGSTTMAARLPGTDFLYVQNYPSDHVERHVSTILMAKSNTPMRIFTDVEKGHWAKSAIESLFKMGTVTGYPGGAFHPSESITRTQAAIMLVRQLGLDTANLEDPGFTDVDKEYKYFPEIAASQNAGLFNGREEGKFAPKGILTRAEMAVILERSYHMTQATKSYFPDVPKSHYAYEAINAMAESGLTSGYPDGTFKPNQPVTRAEFSAFLERVQPPTKFLRVKDLNGSNLNVRARSTTNSDVVGQLESYDNVTVLIGKDGNLVQRGEWYKVIYKGKRAWVHRDYVN